MRLTVLAALALAGCGRVSPEGSAQDAMVGVDSDAPETVAEVADTSSADVWSLPLDAAPPPLDGSWSNVPGLPECPNIWLARSPATDLADDWSPCPSGRVGCMRLATPWAGGWLERVHASESMARQPSGEEVYEYSRVFPYDAKPRPFLSIVQSPVTIPRLALLAVNTGQCSAGLFPASADAVVGAIFAGRPNLHRFITVPYGSPAAPTDVFDLSNDQIDSYEGRLTGITVGERRIYLATSEEFAVHSIAVVDRATHAVIKKVTPDSPPIALATAVAGGAIASWHKWPYGIAFIDENGAVEKLHTHDEMSYPPQVDPSTGTIVWIGLSGGGRPTLWAAAAASRASAFRPRLLANLDVATPGASVANDGYAVVVLDELRALLVRLSDGARWVVAPEPEDRWMMTAYVTSKEIALVVGDRGSSGSSELKSVVRRPIAGLGPPTY